MIFIALYPFYLILGLSIPQGFCLSRGNLLPIDGTFRFFISTKYTGCQPPISDIPENFELYSLMGGLEELGYFLFDFYPPFIEKKKQLEVSSEHFHALNGFALRGATFRVLPKKYHIKGIVHLAQVRLMVFFKGF
jgi:hypothetical protein